jgi:hypothetical protein
MRMDLGGMWELASFGSGYGPVADSCEHGDEPSGPDATELVSMYTSRLRYFTSVPQISCYIYSYFFAKLLT